MSISNEKSLHEKQHSLRSILNQAELFAQSIFPITSAPNYETKRLLLYRQRFLTIFTPCTISAAIHPTDRNLTLNDPNIQLFSIAPTSLALGRCFKTSALITYQFYKLPSFSALPPNVAAGPTKFTIFPFSPLFRFNVRLPSFNFQKARRDDFAFYFTVLLQRNVEASFFSVDLHQAILQPNLLLFNSHLRFNPTPTFLGVTFDRTLSFFKTCIFTEDPSSSLASKPYAVSLPA